MIQASADRGLIQGVLGVDCKGGLLDKTSNEYFLLLIPNICCLDHDRARKHGLEDLIQADPSTFNHHVLFEKLQNLTLTHRLNDSYSCLVCYIC